MILSILFLILSFFPMNFYKRILISTITTVIIYPPITLFSISIVRASIMAVCLAISYYFDRNPSSFLTKFYSSFSIFALFTRKTLPVGKNRKIGEMIPH